MGKGFDLAELERISAGIMPGSPERADDQVVHLAKLVHILWKEVEKLEKIARIVKMNSEGLTIKIGSSEISVLENGGIILDGRRILLKTPGKQDLYF